LANRLAYKIINLESELGEDKTSKDARALIKSAKNEKAKVYTDMRTKLQDLVKKLNGSGKSITEYARTVAKYKNEAQYVEQTDLRMKQAERELARISYAFSVLQDSTFAERLALVHE